MVFPFNLCSYWYALRKQTSFFRTIRKSRFISAMMNYWYYLILIYNINIKAVKRISTCKRSCASWKLHNNFKCNCFFKQIVQQVQDFQIFAISNLRNAYCFFSCQRDLKWCADFASQKRLIVGSTFFNDEFENRNHEISSQTHKRFFFLKSIN